MSPPLRLSVERIRRLLRTGHDTAAIAELFRVPEAAVWNALAREARP